ncbi:hypothetical protein NECID01_1686 [Nematocida sp. AWRm77]|nr:hypothetical protein NECID01_1686 [Nematocida sp. AWRm77]
MAGVNGYFNGKYVSKRERHVILSSCIATILYILSGYILFYATKSSLVITSAVLELSKCLFISHMSCATINALIIMEGFMERNIVQIVLTTFLNLILFLTTVISISLYDITTTKYIFFGISILNAVFDLYILLLAFGLRKEFGWFYYKTHGANLQTSVARTVRKTQSVFIRLIIQIFLSFWLFDARVVNILSILIACMIMVYVVILLYIIESRYESYVLRTINIVLSLLILAYMIQHTVLFPIIGKPFYDEGESHRYFIPILSYLSVNILIMIGYVATLVIDVFYFNKGLKGYYTHRQRRRAALT